MMTKTPTKTLPSIAAPATKITKADARCPSIAFKSVALVKADVVAPKVQVSLLDHLPGLTHVRVRPAPGSEGVVNLRVASQALGQPIGTDHARISNDGRCVTVCQPTIAVGSQVAITLESESDWGGDGDDLLLEHYWGEVLAVTHDAVVLRLQWGLSGVDEGSDVVDVPRHLPMVLPQSRLRSVHTVETWLKSPGVNDATRWNFKTIDDFPWAVGPDGKAL